MVSKNLNNLVPAFKGITFMTHIIKLESTAKTRFTGKHLTSGDFVEGLTNHTTRPNKIIIFLFPVSGNFKLGSEGCKYPFCN